MPNVSRIFVVEGDENLNRSIVNTLHKDGYDVRGVVSGADAVRILWSEEYDVVICDANTPGIDGVELLQWLRAYRPQTRMILIGGAEPTSARMQALESGAAGYLEKPIDIYRLKEELRRLLQQTGFSANLDSFDLLDVIQIITMSRRSIALLVSTGLEERGTLRFYNGELIWAEYGMLRGEEAFFALAAHKNGTVVHQPWNGQVTPNVRQPLSRLILQALQYRAKYGQGQHGQQQGVNDGNAGVIENVEEAGGIETEGPLSFVPEEIDDSPFAVLVEQPAQSGYDAARQGMEEGQGIEGEQQVAGQRRQSVRAQQPAVQPGQSEQTDNEQLAWWERTGTFPRLGDMRTEHGIGGAGTTEVAAGSENGNSARSKGVAGIFGEIAEHIETSASQPAKAASQRDDLPSWLTDQPTSSVPVTRPSALTNTARIPASSPGQSGASLEWQPPQVLKTTEVATGQLGQVTGPIVAGQGQVTEATSIVGAGAIGVPEGGVNGGSKNRSQEMAMRIPIPVPAQQVAPPTQTAQQVRQSTQGQQQDKQGIVEGRGRMSETQSGQGYVLTDPQKFAPTSSPVATPTGSIGKSGVQQAQREARRQYNYSALVAALQTLGYSINGFIAAAVVSLEGQPVAQVAVDDLDISSVCRHFSVILKSTLVSLDQSAWGEYEHMVITSAERRILMRVVRGANGERAMFHVLVTTQTCDAGECLEIMANVEGAIAAALRL